MVRCYTVLALGLKIQEAVTLTSSEKALKKITGKLHYPAEQIIQLCNCKQIDITLFKTL